MDFSEINYRALHDPYEFVQSCEAEYDKKVADAARTIADGIEKSCIILLSGPSGSGKTTTAHKLARALGEFGAGVHTVSLDNYFKTFDETAAPRTETGEVDYESPYCLDLPLLHEQIEQMVACKEVQLPEFSFANQRRSDSTIPLCRRKNEIVIIEGIHALNDMVTASAGEHGFKLYISARSNFMENDELVFKGTWTRLVRRLVRDDRFRSTKAAFTLSIWDSIRVGEKKFISPFRDRADIIINSTHDYEINMLKKHLTSLFAEIPKDILRYDEIMCIPRALERFADIDDELVPKDSLLREFIGGGSFHY